MIELIDGVKKYALEHYGENSWDIVTETMDDNDIADIIGKARTLAGAIKKMTEYVTSFDERRRDIEATAW